MPSKSVCSQTSENRNEAFIVELGHIIRRHPGQTMFTHQQRPLWSHLSAFNGRIKSNVCTLIFFSSRGHSLARLDGGSIQKQFRPVVHRALATELASIHRHTHISHESAVSNLAFLSSAPCYGRSFIALLQPPSLLSPVKAPARERQKRSHSRQIPSIFSVIN